METKLTLKLDSELIEKAKKYAKEHDESLSKVVENFFRFLPDENKKEMAEEIEITPWVKSMMSEKHHDPNINYDEIRYQRLKEKYNL